MEGYFKETFGDLVSYVQYKNNKTDGYGILRYADERVYRGLFKNGKYDSYGLMKYPNKDEFDGQWTHGRKQG